MKESEILKSKWSVRPADQTYQAYLKETNKKIGAFLSFSFNEKSEAPGEFQDIPVAVKDNIAVKNQPLTCASKLLKNLVSPYDATVVARLKSKGAVVIGKTNLDEFGMGSSNQDSALAETFNPWNLEVVPGGSSGGSAAAVAAGMVPLAIGTDTGGSVRQPAMFNGVYGFKPTYGAVSRYGLTAYASSLEVPGFIARSVGWIRLALEYTAGVDIYDQTTTSDPLAEVRTIKKVGYLEAEEGLSPGMLEEYKLHIEAWKNLGFEMIPIELSSLEYAVPVYYTIATAEASANLARFNGIRYGVRPEFAQNPQELVKKARTEGFGLEVKRRILLGTYVLRSGFQDQYYHRAQKIRTLIRRDFDQVFEQVDLLLMPVYPTQAFPRGKSGLSHLQQKLADKFTVGANLTGNPAIAIPAGVKNGLPIGFQLMAPALHDRDLLQMAELWESTHAIPSAPDYPPRWED